MISIVFGALVSASADLHLPDQDVTMHDVAVESESFEQFIEGMSERGAYEEIHSLLVYQQGKIIGERYFSGNADYIDFPGGVKRVNVPDRKQWSASDLHYVASVNKSVTALATGIWLKEQGRDVTQTLAPLLPAYQMYFSDPVKAELNVHHVLSMQSGFLWDEWNDNDLAELWQSDDFATFLLKRVNHGPGKEWRYNSATLNLLFEAMQETLSVPLQEWVRRRLYHPLGISELQWGTQPSGVAEASARLSLLPRDMLKLGILILQGGRWEGTQIVPSGWIKKMCTAQAEGPAGAYGYGIWPREVSGIPVCTAEGDGGQYIHVIEEKGLVVVMTQGNYLQWPLYRNQSDEILRRLLTVLDSPEPES